jgi:hypothetical protein
MRVVLSIVALCALAMLRFGPADDDLYFETQVRPILKTHCFLCHGEGEKKEGNLDLRLVRFMARGGDSGAAIVAHHADDSLLHRRIAADEMPPGKKKLTPAEKETIRRWLNGGAKTLRPEPESVPADTPWTDEERSYWAFQPVRRPPLPAVAQPQLVQSPIDHFLLTKLEASGLNFSPSASPDSLVRRVWFDLVGLPPPPERVAQFKADPSPAAYARMVDELLASPAYGERWARHWLDVAGYADSDGYTENDPVRPWAYRYRDYVIRSLNDDKPFDQFIVEQGRALFELILELLRSVDVGA